MPTPTTNRLASPWTRSEIREALEKKQIVPFFQPKIALGTNDVTGMEALARWFHPTLGTLKGELFMEAIERLGMVDELTNAIFRQVLTCVEQWKRAGHFVPVAVNFSPETLQKKSMARRITSIVGEYEVCPGDVTIEVTETMPLRDVPCLRRALCYLREHEFGISADDFGTGYAGLGQLKELPYTEIKIDRSFIAGSTKKPKAVAILESIVGLAQKLRIPTVAEGIESAIDSELAKAIGCTVGQGFYIGYPMPNEALETWMFAKFQKAAIAA